MLKLDKVIFNYPEFQFNFDFELAAGHCLGILGESGSGKSTLLNLIAGFLPPESGHIYFDGQRIDQLKAHERPLTILFQEHNLFNHLTVYQNIGLGISPSLKLTNANQKTIYDALEKVGLPNMDKRLPESLSGGQRQRVALARCLVRSRPILLLDEPFSGLNSEIKTEVKALLMQLKTELNLTMLWVTHDQTDLQGVSDQLAFIEQDRLNRTAKAALIPHSSN